MAWSALAWLLLAAPRRPAGAVGPGEAEPSLASPDGLQPGQGKIRGTEIAIILTVALIGYWPWFLSRYGPYLEDKIILEVLQRMMAGDIPYVDFEFLYGPLLIFPAAWWTRLTEFSLTAHYVYVAVGQALTFLFLVVLLQKLVPDRRHRWLCFLLLSPFMLDTLMGINSLARRWVPVIIALVVAYRPAWSVVRVGAPVALGLSVAYSYDGGLMAVAAVLGLYGTLALSATGCPRGHSWWVALLTTLFGTVATWLLVSLALMGGGLGAYLETTRYLAGRFSVGEAGFPFYWTASSLALFALLSLAIVRLARGGIRFWRWKLDDLGDRMLVVAVLFVLVGLKGGLNRADQWHLVPPFFPLLVVAAIGWRGRSFPSLSLERKVATGLVAVASIAFLIGSAPTGSALARGWVRGALDTFGGVPRAGAGATGFRAPSVQPYRTSVNPLTLELGRALASPPLLDRPLFYYGTAWNLPPLIGTLKEDYLNDDFLYSDERGQLQLEWLQEHPRALILIKPPVFERLYGLRDPDAVEESGFVRPTLTKRIASVTSTIHFGAVAVEERLKEERWARTVGHWIVDRYRLLTRIGNNVILEPVDAPVTGG